MSPVQTTIIIIAVVTIFGVVVSFMRKSSALAGYDDVKIEVPKIASALKAEMFRDGEDLVLTGNYKNRPAQVRFSYAENTPGLNIRMQAPVSFTFSSVPKGATATEGRVLIRTGSDMFDAKFASRTDHPTQAKMLVGGRATLQNIEKLCCSQKTYLTMTRGSIELSELVIPDPYTSRHVLDHLESMAIIARAVDDIPGAESVKVVPYEREKSTPVFRVALIIAAVAAVLGVIFIRPSSVQSGATNIRPIDRAEGVNAVDAAHLGDVKGWHALTAEEYDPDVAGSLRSIGVEPNGHLTIDLDGDDQPDQVYLLVSDTGKNRITILRNNKKVYETTVAPLAGALPVPKSEVASIRWQSPPQATNPNADAVLLLTHSGDHLQPVILIITERQVYSGIPADWRAVPIS